MNVSLVGSTLDYDIAFPPTLLQPRLYRTIKLTTNNNKSDLDATLWPAWAVLIAFRRVTITYVYQFYSLFIY